MAAVAMKAMISTVMAVSRKMPRKARHISVMGADSITASTGPTRTSPLSVLRAGMATTKRGWL